MTASELADVDALLSTRRMRELDEARVRIANHVCVEDVDDRTRRVPVDREVRRLMKMGKELRGLYETEAEEGGGGGGGGADAAEASSTAKSASEGGTVPRRRRFSEAPPLGPQKSLEPSSPK